MMPIRTFLVDGRRFDDDTVRIMGVAFEYARVALAVADRDDPLNQVIANKIIALARQGESDPELLCELALADLRASPPGPHR